MGDFQRGLICAGGEYWEPKGEPEGIPIGEASDESNVSFK